jgi:hypothetical protein
MNGAAARKVRDGWDESDRFATQEGSTMSLMSMVRVQETADATGLDRRPITDFLFVIAFFVAVFTAETALVEFAGPGSSLVGDEQVMILPIT